MIVYVPIRLYEVPDMDKQICDGVLQFFYELEDLKLIHPYERYIILDIEESPSINEN